jgi:two-component system, cell cycle sensor histidine kinase and response regulator CckA
MAQLITVLVVDDDEDVRELAVASLEDQGYRVLAAAGGAEALRLLAAERHVDVLFTDIMMPGLDGFSLAKAALAEHPGLRVVYASGYFAGALTGPGDTPFLPKPYRPSQLAAEIGRVVAY